MVEFPRTALLQAGRGELRGARRGIFYVFTGRLAWLACGTPRLSDMWQWMQSQPSAFPENTRVARPGRGKGLPSGW